MKRQIATRYTGQSTTEYGLVLGLVAVLVIVALVAVNAGVGNVFSSVSDHVQAVVSTGSADGTTPTAMVTPSIQTAGQTVSVTGSGYTPASTVTITLHSTPVVLGTTTADSAGDVSAVVTIPLGTDTTITHIITLTTANQAATSNDLTVDAPSVAISGTINGPTGQTLSRPAAVLSGSVYPAGSDGTYAISGLAYGSTIDMYGVAIEGETMVGACYGTSGTFADCAPVTLNSTAVNGINIQLPANEVSGRVTNSSGQPVAAASVEILSSDGSAALGYGTTASDGTYTANVNETENAGHIPVSFPPFVVEASWAGGSAQYFYSTTGSVVVNSQLVIPEIVPSEASVLSLSNDRSTNAPITGIDIQLAP